ncbi:MAG: FecR family protein, partial [Gammaproteobacteria bacterium]
MSSFRISALLLACLALCVALPAAAATGAGKVVYAFGQVDIVSADGRARAASRGTLFGPGDTVRTRNGRTQLRFTDGGFAALQPNTEYKVEQYEFSGSVDGTERSFLNLVRGSVRLVTGLIGRSNKQNFRLRTAVATIGIRGTAGKASHCDANCGELGPGTSLAGYDGVWDLKSGSYEGPVEPGQAFFCNGSSCFKIPGFGQRRQVAQETDELDETLDENDESTGSGDDEPFYVDGAQSTEDGINCTVANCRADLQVVTGLVAAGANADPFEGFSGETESGDNVALVLNNGLPAAIVEVSEYEGIEEIAFLTNDPGALRQAVLDFPDAEVSANGQAILDAIPEAQVSSVVEDPAQVGEEAGFTSDGFLYFWRWTDGKLLDVALNEEVLGAIETEVIDLTGFQSEHFIVGADPLVIPGSGTAKYSFTGGTYSTAIDGSSIGMGVTRGFLQFDFLSQTGAIDMTVQHQAMSLRVIGELLIDFYEPKFFFDSFGGVSAVTSTGSYPAQIEGFFAEPGTDAPLAAGLSYLIDTATPIIGVAGFGLDGTGALPSGPAAPGTYVAFASNFVDNFGSTDLSSESIDFLVNGNSATLADGIPVAFNSTTHMPCSPSCTFNAGSASTVPSETGTNFALGVSWARFTPGYTASNMYLLNELGSAHVITTQVPTTVADTPDIGSGKTGVYSLISGGTRPTVVFETGGVQQSEVVGMLDTAAVIIDFNTGDVSASFSGSFGSDGIWALGGMSTFNRNDQIHEINSLSGVVSSASITDPGASTTSCAGGCA